MSSFIGRWFGGGGGIVIPPQPISNPTQECIASGKYLQNGQCVSKCFSGYFPNTYSNCVKCPQGQYYNFTSGNCVQNCPQGTYGFNGGCQAGCSSQYYENQITNTCSQFCEGVIYQPNSQYDNEQCLSQCPNGYVYGADRRCFQPSGLPDANGQYLNSPSFGCTCNMYVNTSQNNVTLDCSCRGNIICVPRGEEGLRCSNYLYNTSISLTPEQYKNSSIYNNGCGLNMTNESPNCIYSP